MILPGQTIRTLQLLDPILPRTRFNGVTHGLSIAGYDVRIAEDLWMWPGRFALASTIEKFQMPNDVLGIVHDKSTYVRLGLMVHNTVIEPGWNGYLTLELKMHALRFKRIKRGTAIAQVVFHRLEEPAEQPYTGKYQNQAPGPQKAILEKPVDRSVMWPTHHPDCFCPECNRRIHTLWSRFRRMLLGRLARGL